MFQCVLFCSEKSLSKEIKYEMRGCYLGFEEFDFKEEFDLNNFKNYITKSYDEFKENGFNTVFVDLSQFIDLHITEKFNASCENVLNIIVKEGFKRCLDIHASFYDFSLKYIENDLEGYLTTLSDKSFIKNNREWIVKFNDYYYLDPGVREVRDYIVNLIVDISRKFKFDGVYLNNQIYPENVSKYTFNDSYSYEKYNEDKLSKDSWRRQNLNDFIKVLGEKFKSYKNELKFGIGVNYIWRTKEDDLNGIDYDGYSDYDRGCFDTLNIAKMGYVNYVVVKINDEIKEREDIKHILSWWDKKLRIHLVDIFSSGGENILNVLNEVRENNFVNGFLVSDLKNHQELKPFLIEKAICPRYKSFDSYYTLSDINVSSKVVGGNIEFNILDDGFENTKAYVVYKFPYENLNTSDVKNIKDVIASNGKSTKITIKKDEGVYAITKLNYNSIESRINSAFIFHNDFGIIEESFSNSNPKIINNEIEFNVKPYNKNNQIKFMVEKNGEILKEDSINQESYVFTPDVSGIYKFNIVISNSGKEEILKSHLSVNVKDKYFVVLDAGHGGDELGAKDKDGTLEKNINLSICNHLNKLFESVSAVKVKNIRFNDIKIDLSDRVKLSSFLNGDLFLSIHQNAFDNIKVNGIETYYYLKENSSKNLSDVIQKSLINETKSFDRGIKNSNFVVLRENIIPSVLIECGFISNPDEFNKLITNEYQESISKAIIRGVEEFLTFKNM